MCGRNIVEQKSSAMCGRNIVEQKSSTVCGRNIVEQQVKCNVWSKHKRTKSRVQCVVET